MVLNPVNIMSSTMEYCFSEAQRDFDVVTRIGSNKRMIMSRNNMMMTNEVRTMSECESTTKKMSKKKQKTPNPASIVRRNERERNRIKLINSTFSSLRNCLPTTLDTKKRRRMSKVDILRNAALYIRTLATVVKSDETQSQTSPMSSASCPPASEQFYSSTTSSPATSDNGCYSPSSEPDYSTNNFEQFFCDSELADALQDWLD